MRLQSIDSLIRLASEITGISPAKLYGASHERHICAVRAAVYVYAHSHLGMTKLLIADKMARHHSSIISAMRREHGFRKLFPYQFDGLIQALKDGDKNVTLTFEPCQTLQQKGGNPKPYPLSEQHHRYIDEQLHAGRGTKDIAEQMGISFHRIRKARARWLKNNPDRRTQRRYTPEEVAQIKTLKNAGHTWAEISKITGFDRNKLKATYSRILEREGLR